MSDDPFQALRGTARPPGAHEPAFNIPHVVLALAMALAAIHGLRNLLDDTADWHLAAEWGFVSGRFSLWLGQATIPDLLMAQFGPSAGRLGVETLPSQVRALIDAGPNAVLSLLSYGLLHGSLGHMVTNALWLIVFGSPVSRRLGAGRFLLLLVVSSVAGALAQWLWDPLALAPLVGASAAVSGATAAAARFVFQEGIAMGDLGRDDLVRAIPAARLGRLFANPRALAFVGFWFAANLIFGTGVIPLAGEDASIAWQAHIGGFLAGLLLFPALDRGPVSRR